MSTEFGEPIILLAEDNENDVLMFRRAFKDFNVGTVVQVVNDGEQALEYLKGEGKYANRDEYPLPTLLLLDLKMPRLNGFEVLEWIRNERSLRGLLVVVLTTSGRIIDVNRAYQLGANSFLTKPLDLSEFRVMVDSLRKYWLTFNRPPTTERPKRGESNGNHKKTNGTSPK
jgi:CheY-like chemotaxis protein